MELTALSTASAICSRDTELVVPLEGNVGLNRPWTHSCAAAKLLVRVYNKPETFGFNCLTIFKLISATFPLIGYAFLLRYFSSNRTPVA